VSFPADGGPRYVVGTIGGAAINPDGSAAGAEPAAYVYDRARCFAIVREYRGTRALAQAEGTAARLEQQVIGEPPRAIPAGSRLRHGTYSCYVNLRCRCYDCAEYTRRTNREWKQTEAARIRSE
jgi:hypothetical protein